MPARSYRYTIIDQRFTTGGNVSARCKLCFQGHVVNERAIRICLCRAKRRGGTSRVIAFRARARPTALGQVTQGEGTMMNVSPRHETRLIFAFMLCQPCAAVIRPTRDHAIGHARKKNRPSMCYRYRFAFLD